MATKSKSAELEDRTLAAEIAKAHEFAACLHLGPNNRLYERNFADYEAARAAADKMETQSKFGRKAVVYGISKLGSFPCDAEMIALARSL